MAEITSIEKAREKRRRQRRLRRLIVAGLLAVLTVVLILNRDALKNLELDQVMDSGLSEEVENRGFPISLPSANTYQMQQVGGCLALLTDSRLYFYSAAGKLLSSFQHGIASPCIAIGGDNAAVYHQNSTQLELFSPKNNKTTVLKTDSAILSAVLSQRGQVCVIQSAQRHMSELVVYSNSGEELFRWSSQNIMVDACFIGEDRIAAICLSSNGGVMTSTVYFYSLHEESPYATLTYSENLLLSLDAKSDGTLVAVGDQGALSFNSQGEQISSWEYSEEGLSYFDNTKDMVILVLGDYTKYKTNQILFLDQKLELLKSYTTQNRVADLAAGSGKSAVLFEGSLLLYQKGEEQLHLYVTQYDRMEAAFLDNTLLLRNDSQIFNDGLKDGNQTASPSGDSAPNQGVQESSLPERDASHSNEESVPSKVGSPTYSRHSIPEGGSSGKTGSSSASFAPPEGSDPENSSEKGE